MRLRRLSTLDDPDLLVAAATDHAAFAEFYDRHLPTLLAYLRRQVSAPDVAFDLAAETFARVLENIERYDRSRGAPMAWVFSIAHNLLVDGARQGVVADRARRELSLSPVQLWDADLEQVERLADLGSARARDALDALSDDQQHAVWARVVLERDYDAIADDLQCSQSVVRQRVSRGLKALHTRLTKESE